MIIFKFFYLSELSRFFKLKNFSSKLYFFIFLKFFIYHGSLYVELPNVFAQKVKKSAYKSFLRLKGATSVIYHFKVVADSAKNSLYNACKILFSNSLRTPNTRLTSDDP